MAFNGVRRQLFAVATVMGIVGAGAVEAQQRPQGAPAADFSVFKTNSATTVTAGGQTIYTISVTNNGSFSAPCTLTDALPAGAASATWTSTNGHSGTGGIVDTATYAAGQTFVFTMTVQVSPAATGIFTNVATISSPGDTNSSNNSSTDADPVIAAVPALPKIITGMLALLLMAVAYIALRRRIPRHMFGA